ncbi:signal recognition particle-docking protein FtsY [Papillibacter cinnamivorans]|uniref:Signal recognition particle receptor FtsY n=1 Tax=Papillibacter cinnamivorans DSM 12816 TaxID=1122930 RepID=A0A1W1ZE78_9FIRM|nr:signal recognition particle-docking protein FtsY [Papillibacter cinnamivorans]SMC46697.1 fused signal recognition particle receptor [Papillibacter cinnamivorans DSM 12816]
MNLFDRIREGLSKTRKALGGSLGGLFGSFSRADEAFFEELEETLILADLGVETSLRVTEELRERIRTQKLKGAEEIREELKSILTEMLETGDRAPRLGTRPSVILVIGVNGVGKTTTIGKLGSLLKAQGRRVLFCAADTFRAAAADQLEIWAKRSGIDIVRQHEGADPAAVVFDSISAAKARGTDVILCDTAGRLHNKQNLMMELNKISRIIDRELPGADRETLLVLDATTGQNGLVQARQFKEAAGVTGIVLTKLDGTAKGGIVIAVADALKIPVKYIGVGERIEDLVEFDPRAFVDALL